MREQVYTDPRPKEYFDRFHERARTREPDWAYELVRLLTSLYGYTFFRARPISTEKVPGSGAVSNNVVANPGSGGVIQRRARPRP